MSRAVMQQALENICGAKLCEINSMSSRVEMVRLMDSAITALRAALAEPEQEPVAWMKVENFIDAEGLWDERVTLNHDGDGKPLYTAPTPRKPLTVFEIDAIAEHLDKTTIGWATHEFAAAIEKAHGIGEQHE